MPLNSPQVYAMVALVVVCAAASIGFYSLAPNADFTKPLTLAGVFGTTVTLVTVALTAFNWWLWRVLPRPLVPKPDLVGTWKVTLTPEVLSSNTSATNPPVQASSFVGYIIVDQHYARFWMRLVTQATESTLKSGEIRPTSDGGYGIWAIYDCQPKGPRTDQNLAHHGAMHLTYRKQGESVNLKGHYWMDRELLIDNDKRLPTRSGWMEAVAHSSREYVDFEDASKAFQS